MNEALEIFYYTLGKFWNFIFGAYIFDGVSLGMIFVTCTIFVILLTYAVAIPKIRVGGARYDKSQKDSSNSSNGSNSND